ncbi:MAG: large-conductance mechanosensitive channel protein MscL [Verrucomicrobia bacterium]|nr:MAG: large-conductance mechanosensitive channel protein MscL [Verrucomicrobiota bacterium]
MSLMKEFREFAVKGNVADMAIGIIIGSAFGKIATSLVNDVIMPPLGLLIGGIDFSQKAVTLKAAAGGAPAVVLKYGVFINSIVDFTLVALAMFLVIKGMNALRKKEATAPVAPTTSEKLLTEIRDLLKK